MSNNRKKIPFKEYRAVLSDVLPYEVPIIFSNRSFYEFIDANKIHISNFKLYWLKKSSPLDSIVKIIFGIAPGNQCFEVQKLHNGIVKSFQYTAVQNPSKIPFLFYIKHKKNEFRTLGVPHPLSQILTADFYAKHCNDILYHCSKSEFSLRRPNSVAKTYYTNDSVHTVLKNNHDDIELAGREYETLKTYFSYREISNVHKFYESFRYQRCEKKFEKMSHLDVEKCFDRIYTHSISWALLTKEAVKREINPSKSMFSGLFDTLMQSANYSETNGILIGPEFSRIFSEIVLQHIDNNIQKNSLQTSTMSIKRTMKYVDMLMTILFFMIQMICLTTYALQFL